MYHILYISIIIPGYVKFGECLFKELLLSLAGSNHQVCQSDNQVDRKQETQLLFPSISKDHPIHSRVSYHPVASRATGSPGVCLRTGPPSRKQRGVVGDH